MEGKLLWVYLKCFKVISCGMFYISISLFYGFCTFVYTSRILLQGFLRYICLLDRYINEDLEDIQYCKTALQFLKLSKVRRLVVSINKEFLCCINQN